MGGVDTSVARMGVDGNADVGVRRIHDVGPMTGAAHERSGQRCHGLATAYVLADLGPTAWRAADDVAGSGMGKEAATRHRERPAISGGGH